MDLAQFKGASRAEDAAAAQALIDKLGDGGGSYPRYDTQCDGTPWPPGDPRARLIVHREPVHESTKLDDNSKPLAYGIALRVLDSETNDVIDPHGRLTGAERAALKALNALVAPWKPDDPGPPNVVAEQQLTEKLNEARAERLAGRK